MGGGSDRVELDQYVFSSRCVRYIHDAIYIFSCTACRYYFWVRFFEGNSVQAVAEYQQRFPKCRIPTRRVFIRVYQTLRDAGTLPGVCIATERDVNEGVDDKEGIVQMVKSSPSASRRRIARRLRVTHKSVDNTAGRGHVSVPPAASATSQTWRFCWGSNFASGTTVVPSCIVTSCLLTNRNSIATVSIIHTILMCGQM